MTAQPVRVDATQTRRALSYLIWYLAYNSPGDQASVSVSVGGVAAGRGRFREFAQCDIDTVGSASPLADAEVVCAVHDGLEALGVSSPRCGRWSGAAKTADRFKLRIPTISKTMS